MASPSILRGVSAVTLPPRTFSRSTRERADKFRSPAHRKWVRSHACILWEHGECHGRTECAHVKQGNGATNRSKASDAKTLSFCQAHHREQTAIGEARFQIKYNIDMNALADEFAARSPYRKQLGMAPSSPPVSLPRQQGLQSEQDGAGAALVLPDGAALPNPTEKADGES